MSYLAVKNFEQFQHYKDRAPLWVKLYNALLDDYAFLKLPEAAQAQLIKLWLLASRMDNRMPNDARYLGDALHTSRIYLAEIIAAGFLVEIADVSDVPGVRADWASRHIPSDVRATVLARTDGHCASCNSTEHIEIDHIVPVSKGGTGDEANLQPLCRRCNRQKRTRTLAAEQVATQGDVAAEPSRARGEKRREEKRINSSHAEHENGVEATVKKEEQPLGAGTVALELTPEDLGTVRQFLESRRPHTHPAWWREMAKLVTGTPYCGADLAGACSDALALETPISGPHALRAFMAKRRDERLKGAAVAPGSRVPSQEDRRQAEAREKREEDKRSKREREYVKQRDVVVAEWEAAHPTELSELQIRARGTIAGAKVGNIGDLIRREWVVREITQALGFPSVDDWRGVA